MANNIWMKDGVILTDENGHIYICENCPCVEPGPPPPPPPIEGGTAYFADIVETYDTYRTDELNYDDTTRVLRRNAKIYLLTNSSAYIPNTNNRSSAAGFLKFVTDDAAVTEQVIPMTFSISGGKVVFVKDPSQNTTTQYSLSSDSTGVYFVPGEEETIRIAQQQNTSPFYTRHLNFFTIPVTLNSDNNVNTYTGLLDHIREQQEWDSDWTPSKRFVFSGLVPANGGFVQPPVNNYNINSSVVWDDEGTRMKKILSLDFSNVGDIVSAHPALSSHIALMNGTVTFANSTNTNDLVQGDVVNALEWSRRDFYVDRIVPATSTAYVWQNIEHETIITREQFSHVFSAQSFVPYDSSNWVGKITTQMVNGINKNLIFFANSGYARDDYGQPLFPAYNHGYYGYTYMENEGYVENYDGITETTCINSNFAHTNPLLTGYITNRIYFIKHSEPDLDVDGFLYIFPATYTFSYSSFSGCVPIMNGNTIEQYKIKVSRDENLDDYIYISNDVDFERNPTASTLICQCNVHFDTHRQKYYIVNDLRVSNSLLTNAQDGEGRPVYYSSAKEILYTKIPIARESDGTWDGLISYAVTSNGNNSFQLWSDDYYFNGNHTAIYNSSDDTLAYTVTKTTLTNPWSGETSNVWSIVDNGTTYYLSLDDLPDHIFYDELFVYHTEAEGVTADLPLFGVTHIDVDNQGYTSLHKLYVNPSQITNATYTYEAAAPYGGTWNVAYDTDINKYYFIPTASINGNVQSSLFFIINNGCLSTMQENYFLLPNKKWGIADTFKSHQYSKLFSPDTFNVINCNRYDRETFEVVENNNVPVSVTCNVNNTSHSITTAWLVDIGYLCKLTQGSNNVWSFTDRNNQTHYLTGILDGGPPPYYYRVDSEYQYQHCKIFSGYCFTYNNIVLNVYRRYYDANYGYVINTNHIIERQNWSSDNKAYYYFKKEGNKACYNDTINPYLACRINQFNDSWSGETDSLADHFNANAELYESHTWRCRSNYQPGYLHYYVGNDQCRKYTVGFFIDTNNSDFISNSSSDEEYIDESFKQASWTGVYCQIITGFQLEMEDKPTYYRMGESVFATLALNTHYAIAIDAHNLNILNSYSDLTGWTYNSPYNVNVLQNGDEFSLNFVTLVRPIRMSNADPDVPDNFKYTVPSDIASQDSRINKWSMD